MRAVLAFLAMLVASPALAGDPQPFLRGSWQEVRQEHAGRPFIVHFWGLTCGPCLAELPQWGRFMRERPELAMVMIDADPVVGDPGAIAATLAKAGLASAETWMFADPFTERLAYEVDPHWAGELPYTLLIRGDGSVKALPGTADFPALRDWVDRQVRQPPQ